MRLLRKIIRIKAEDSPNVQRGLAQRAAGMEPDDLVVVPGILTYGEYLDRLATWDKVRQCIGLAAEFWEGADLLLYPPDWLNRAEAVYRGGINHSVPCLGVDTGKGGDKTSWCAGSAKGIKRLKAIKTPDTSIINGMTIAMMSELGIDPRNVMFDLGDGGKVHVDGLRAKGFPVRGVWFGEKPTLTIKRHRRAHPYSDRVEIKEEKAVYKNMRTQMYHETSQLLDPDLNPEGFGIPAEELELRRQMAPIPKLTDDEGKYWMLPKKKRTDDDDRPCLEQLLGCSPDELDSLVMMVHASLHPVAAKHVGAVI